MTAGMLTQGDYGGFRRPSLTRRKRNMDPLRNAIEQRAFTPEARAEIAERFDRIATALETAPQFDDDIDAVVNERLGLTEQDDAAILDHALSSLDNLQAFAAMRKFPAKGSGKTTRTTLPCWPELRGIRHGIRHKIVKGIF
jgi:hypothetical protein